MAEQRGSEPIDVAQSYNFRVQKQRLNSCFIAFLSLLLLLSTASARILPVDPDGGEGLRVPRNWLQILPKGPKIPDGAGRREYSSNQDFGRDPNRLEYFRVAPFDVYGDDRLTGNAYYGDGGGSTDHSPVILVGGSDTTPQQETGGHDDGGIVQGLEQESNGVGEDDEDGGDVLVEGWWDKLWVWLALWWVWLALWKMV